MSREVTSADLEMETIGEGPPILFVHGSVVGVETWRHQRPLAERWTLLLPSRPGFGASPPLERLDFEAEAPLFAELLGDGAHLVGHSYGSVIALLAAALRPEAVRSLTISEPGSLRVAAGAPGVDEMIANGELLFSDPEQIPTEHFLRMFRYGAGSSHSTPDEFPEELQPRRRAAEARAPVVGGRDPPRRAEERAPFPKLVISGGHSEVFEAVCDAHAEGLGAERATIAGRGHTIPGNGAPYNDRLERFLEAATG